MVYTDERGETNAYLSQVAYDRYHIVNDRLDLDTFYGWFLKADWEDGMIEAAFYEDGQQKRVSKRIGPKAKTTQECGYYYTGIAHYYNSYFNSTTGDLVIDWQREYVYHCFEEGSGGGAWEEYPYEVPEGGGGGGGGPIYVPVTTNYNLKNAVCNPGGSDRWQMNDNLSKALDGLGLFTGVADFSNSMIEALVRSIAGSGQSAKVVQTVLGRTLGHTTFVIGNYNAIMGIVDGDITDQDALNLLGAVAGTAALFAGGWVAVGLTTISVGIAIYDTYNEHYCN